MTKRMLWLSKSSTVAENKFLLTLGRYIPAGNSKLGAITIENTSSDQSILKFRLYVDGVEAWSSVVLSPPSISGSRWSKDALWG